MPARHADAQALQRLRQRVPLGAPVTTLSSKAQSATLRAIGPGSVAGVRNRHDAGLRPPTGAGAKSDDAAQRRRHAHRAAGIGTHPPGASRAATATAVPPLDPPGMRSVRIRIVGRAEGGVVVGDAEGEFVHVAFAE